MKAFSILAILLLLASAAGCQILSPIINSKPPSTGGATWSMTHQTNTATTSTCSQTSANCAIGITSTASSNTGLAIGGFRCGSATFFNECSMSAVITTNGSASGGTCSGTTLDTLTIAGSLQNSVNNSGFAYAFTSAGGATCVQVTRDTTTADIWIFSFFEFAHTSGGTIALDNLQTSTVPGGSSFTGQSLGISGSNDIVFSVCACAATMNSVTSPWDTNEFFLDHLADSYLLNVSSVPVPTWGSSGTAVGVVGAMAFHN